MDFFILLPGYGIVTFWNFVLNNTTKTSGNFQLDIILLRLYSRFYWTISALLQKVAYLGSEVRNFAMMFDELKSMRSAIDHLVASDIDRCQR